MTDPTLSHPSFPQPDDAAQRIWRYMDRDKFDWLLGHERLFMGTADRLGDPREGSTPPGQIAAWERDAEQATSEEQRNTIEHNRQFFAHFAKFLRQRYYVSCWHMNDHENYSMWRCYTSTPEAVAIRSRYDILRSMLPPPVYMGVIRYIDYSNESLPWGNMFEYITHKDAYFRYEAEVRVVAVPPATDDLGLQDFLADHFALTADADFLLYAPRIDVPKLIEGVVLHPDAPDEFVEHVRKQCAEHGLPTPEFSRGAAKPVY